MKNYILAVGFVLGLIWPYVEFAIFTDQLWRWWELRQKVAALEEQKRIIAITEGAGNVAHGNVIYDSSSYGYPFYNNGDTVPASNIILWSGESDSWPNAKDCPWDEAKKANVCK